jgi:hypothetical protein
VRVRAARGLGATCTVDGVALAAPGPADRGRHARRASLVALVAPVARRVQA